MRPFCTQLLSPAQVSIRVPSTLTRQPIHVCQGFVNPYTEHPQRVICRHKIIEVAHREQALGDRGVGCAHVWLVCLVGWVAAIVLAMDLLGCDGGRMPAACWSTTFAGAAPRGPDRDRRAGTGDAYRPNNIGAYRMSTVYLHDMLKAENASITSSSNPERQTQWKDEIF